MKKIPTVFMRDWDGDPSRVTDQVTPGCEWVFEGQGTCRRKYDGTCCLVRDGKLYKRREEKPGKTLGAARGIFVGTDEQTGKRVWWVPVGDGPEDAKHRAAFTLTPHIPDDTYELVGPSINKNPEGFLEDTLVRHINMETLPTFPRDYEGMKAFFARHDIEGVVFHGGPDGAMAKIKGKDLGVRRGQPVMV